MLILVFLSLERFLLIAVPLSGYQVLKLNTAVYCMLSIWLVGLSISVAPGKSYVIYWQYNVKLSSKIWTPSKVCLVTKQVISLKKLKQ